MGPLELGLYGSTASVWLMGTNPDALHWAASFFNYLSISLVSSAIIYVAKETKAETMKQLTCDA